MVLSVNFSWHSPEKLFGVFSRTYFFRYTSSGCLCLSLSENTPKVIFCKTVILKGNSCENSRKMHVILTSMIASKESGSVTLSKLTFWHIFMKDLDRKWIWKIVEQLFQKRVFQSISMGDSNSLKLAPKRETTTEKIHSWKQLFWKRYSAKKFVGPANRTASDFTKDFLEYPH